MFCDHIGSSLAITISLFPVVPIFLPLAIPNDAAQPMVDATPRPTSPPRGPITRARAKEIHDKVNSLLALCDIDYPLDGLLPHADRLTIIRYKPQEESLDDRYGLGQEGEETTAGQTSGQTGTAGRQARPTGPGRNKPVHAGTRFGIPNWRPPE